MRLRLLYREDGDLSKSTIVLLHGFPPRPPSSTTSFRFRRIGFTSSRRTTTALGFSEAPVPTVLQPTFDDVATVIEAFIAQRAAASYLVLALGDPIGMLIATAHPGRIEGLIFQPFTISVDGWNPGRLEVYERLGGRETPEKLSETEQFATVERDMFRHKTGAGESDALNPDNSAIDALCVICRGESGLYVAVVYEPHHQHSHYPEWTAFPKHRQLINSSFRRQRKS